MLRDCSLEQVRIRSPRPERPVSVSGRAPIAVPNRISSAKPRVISPACALLPSCAPGDDAAGDGEHVLHRAAELRAEHVVRPVEPQRAAAERVGDRMPDLLASRGEGQRGGQAARDLAGKARPREHAGQALRQRFGDDVGHHLAGVFLEALGADDHRLAADMRLNSSATVRKNWLGTTIRIRSAAATSAVFAVARDVAVERHAGQIDVIAVLVVDFLDRLALIAPRARHRARHGAPRPPGPCPRRPRR